MLLHTKPTTSSSSTHYKSTRLRAPDMCASSTIYYSYALCTARSARPICDLRGVIRAVSCNFLRVAPSCLWRLVTHVYVLTTIYRFRISANAFFQINTPAAEVLYSIVREWCNAGPETTVLGIFNSALLSHNHESLLVRPVTILAYLGKAGSRALNVLFSHEWSVSKTRMSINQISRVQPL